MDATKLALVKDLRGYDHAFINAEGVKHFAKGFGVKLRAYRHHADASPDNPKGLMLDDGAESAVGLDAAELAEDICRALGVSYVPKMGRGSRLRSACDALETHFGS